LTLAAASPLACAPDSVAPGYYAAEEAGTTFEVVSGHPVGLDATIADDAPGDFDDDAPFEAGTPASPQCDMNGRWLVAQRVLADALGQTQASHNWFYYEIVQNGDALVVTRGLHCGYEVVAVTALGANVNSEACWPDFLQYDSDTGRTGTMDVTASGCQLSLEKRYTVRGASVSYYEDPSTTLPTKAEKASGSTPGWISWCGANNPGITLIVTGAASGDLYCVQRDWTEYSGAVDAGATTFEVPVTWGSDQDALGYSGSSLITMQDEPDSDPSQAYVWFAKLDASQVAGSDAEICATVRSLVPTLVPDALQ
jgi:hypothetical protein